MEISVLHLTDLHYSEKDNEFLKELSEKIINNIDDKKVDFVIFSGDLVESPSLDNFETAFENFIKPILLKCKLDISDCFFTTGNHDINKVKRDNILFSGLKDYIVIKNDKKSIEDLISHNRILEEVKEYKEFIDKYSTAETLILNNQLYTVYIKKINNIKIGIVSINSSIFMEKSEVDYGRLYIPEVVLLQAANEIKDTNIKVINLHHSFNWYQNKKEIEKILLDKFNLVFFGHEHEHDGKYIFDLQNRDILTLHGTAIHHKKNELNGYCIYTYDLDKLELNISNSIYDKKQRVFQNIETKLQNIDLTTKSNKVIRNQAICSRIYPNILNKINKYLSINLTSERNQQSLEQIYINQKIVLINGNKTIENHFEKENSEKNYSISDLITEENNLLLMGKTESGKTTTLNMINLSYLKDFNELIPIFLFAAEMSQEDSERILISKIGEYLDKHYGEHKFKIAEMLSQKRFVLLIDDIQLLKIDLVKKILNFENKIIATFTDNINSKIENMIEPFSDKSDVFESFKRLEIKSLRKKDCSSLVKNIVPAHLANKISNKVQKSLTKLRLPSNPLITTLLIWMHMEKINIRENEPEIIDIFLDYLLEKTDMSKNFEGKIDFKDKKDLLAVIACEFFQKKSFAINENDILVALINRLNFSSGKDIGANDILEYFYNRRILVKNNNKVMFSYRVFYYYFISLHMMNDIDFRNTIMRNKKLIVNMIDELRYYSAMSRHDFDFFYEIFQFTEENFFNKKTISQKVNLSTIINLKKDNYSDTLNSSISSKELNEEVNLEVIDLTSEEKQISDEIDDVMSETRDTNIQKYNCDVQENINLIEQKKYREEYFVLTIIASEFLKHFNSSISFDLKKEYLNKLLKNYSLSMEYWNQVLSDQILIKRFMKQNLSEEIQDMKDDELVDAIEYIKTHINFIITETMEGTLATPKLDNCFKTIINETDDLNKYFFILLVLTEIGREELLVFLEKFIEFNTDSMLFKILERKLIYDYVKQNYSASVKKGLYDLLLKLNIINNKSKSEIKTNKLLNKYLPYAKKSIDAHIKLVQIIS